METKTLTVKDLLKVEQLTTQHVNIEIKLISFDQIQIKLNNKKCNALFKVLYVYNCSLKQYQMKNSYQA